MPLSWDYSLATAPSEMNCPPVNVKPEVGDEVAIFAGSTHMGFRPKRMRNPLMVFEAMTLALETQAHRGDLEFRSRVFFHRIEIEHPPQGLDELVKYILSRSLNTNRYSSTVFPWGYSRERKLSAALKVLDAYVKHIFCADAELASGTRFSMCDLSPGEHAALRNRNLGQIMSNHFGASFG